MKILLIAMLSSVACASIPNHKRSVLAPINSNSVGKKQDVKRAAMPSPPQNPRIIINYNENYYCGEKPK